jgi:hypothetical protein
VVGLRQVIWFLVPNWFPLVPGTSSRNWFPGSHTLKGWEPEPARCDGEQCEGDLVPVPTEASRHIPELFCLASPGWQSPAPPAPAAGTRRKADVSPAVGRTSAGDDGAQRSPIAGWTVHACDAASRLPLPTVSERVSRDSAVSVRSWAQAFVIDGGTDAAAGFPEAPSAHSRPAKGGR